MSLLTVDKVIKKYGNYQNKVISWFNWGEPLLHNEFETIASMVKNTKSAISSNFSLNLTDSKIESLKNFKTIYISISGLTPEIYNIYNIGGNFDLVFKNIERVAELNHFRTVLRWQSHKYNLFQLNSAKEFSDKHGFVFESIDLNCEVEELIEGFEHELLRTPKLREGRGRWCKMLTWICLDVDGNYLLCCGTHNVKLGYHIDDDIHSHHLMETRKKQPICIECRKNNFWRMF